MPGDRQRQMLHVLLLRWAEGVAAVLWMLEGEEEGVILKAVEVDVLLQSWQTVQVAAEVVQEQIQILNSQQDMTKTQVLVGNIVGTTHSYHIELHSALAVGNHTADSNTEIVHRSHHSTDMTGLEHAERNNTGLDLASGKNDGDSLFHSSQIEALSLKSDNCVLCVEKLLMCVYRM